MNEDWSGGDPFTDPSDPAAREREQRRGEREEKRRQRAEREREKREKEAAAAPQPPPPAESAHPSRTPEQEFWDEEPEPEGESESEATRSGAAAAAPPVGGGAAQPASPHGSGSLGDWGFHDEGDPEMAGAGGRRRPEDGGGVGGRGSGVLGALRRHPGRVVATILALLVLLFLDSLFQPFHGEGSGRVPVTVPRGASVSEVGDLLSDRGVIDDGFLLDGSTLFQMRVTLAGKRSELYAGHFTLAHGMSYGAAIDALSQPPAKRTVTVTIPEGYSRSQAAQLVEEAGVPGSYTRATVRSKFLDPAEYGGKGAKNLEGFLFPDTFEMKPSAPAADVVELQLKDFKRKIGRVDMGYARSKNLNVFDVLTIASMVEDEAGVPSQRKLVASVIYNRLHEGMPLGIDATIRFATGNYTKPLTQSETEIDSPYNTRTNTGLPPGPINSPGLAAIEAAAHPAKTGYLFYVNDPNGCNELTFSKDEDEWVRDVERYEKAREQAGGQNPDTCGE